MTVRELELTDVDLPLITVRTVCSRGTYIRTLAHDIGADLGCGGCIETLVRTRSGPYSVNGAITLEDVEKDPVRGVASVVPLDDVRAMLAAEAGEASG